MAKLPLYDKNFKVIGEVDLKDEIFASEVKPHLIHDVVKMQLANRRQGTASTKTRSEVSGGGRKPYKQKGTGRARCGSSRSPLFRKGAILFGPKPRDYSYSLPRKMKKSAMRSVLTMKVSENKLFVIDDIKLPEIRTKSFQTILNNFKVSDVVVVIPDRNREVELSARNIPNVKVVNALGMNVYDLMKHENMILEKGAIEKIEGVL